MRQEGVFASVTLSPPASTRRLDVKGAGIALDQRQMLPLHLKPVNAGRLKLLVLGAHADDIEIGCGGLVLSLLARYPETDVEWVVFSAAGERAREARGSAKLFLRGASRSRIRVRRFTDGFFPHDGARIKQEFEALKQACDPDIVLTHHREDRHQDHRVLSDLAWNTFRNHLILEYEIPKFDGDIGNPNCFVPLESAVCSRKVELLMSAFGSQREKHWFSAETFLGLMRIRGMECRAESGYAEAFYARKIPLQF